MSISYKYWLNPLFYGVFSFLNCMYLLAASCHFDWLSDHWRKESLRDSRKRIMSHSIFVSLSCRVLSLAIETFMAQWLCQIFILSLYCNWIQFDKTIWNSNKTYVELDNKNVLVRFAILLAYLVVNSRHKIESIKYYAFIIFPWKIK